ncbi:hypothetical protein [Jatrophihabitans sp. GAS493]|uniref:hypothetical protein n=1 Tax=Jatrophihabitans sp. GAS493 TaxID=1907575 RepID=UPI000BB6FCF8|nr:hypothetical protein [Jatrophihabitans sp. GAS493]
MRADALRGEVVSSPLGSAGGFTAAGEAAGAVGGRVAGVEGGATDRVGAGGRTPSGALEGALEAVDGIVGWVVGGVAGAVDDFGAFAASAASLDGPTAFSVSVPGRADPVAASGVSVCSLDRP